MHIEIGILSQDKLLLAAAAGSALMAAQLPRVLGRPVLALRAALAAVFFSVLMQLWHLPVGPSELHMVGAMPIYLLFGFVPTLIGFGAGLLLQALAFEPQDMAHLAVNFLSLAVPLVLVHHSLGKKLSQLRVQDVLKLDAVYYSGVTLMVGFWLSQSSVATPLAGWALFASSYLSLVLVEPVLTVALVLLVTRVRSRRVAALCLDERALQQGSAA